MISLRLFSRCTAPRPTITAGWAPRLLALPTGSAWARWLLLSAVLATPTMSYAQWNEVSKARNGDVWMMDTATAIRMGDLARVWVLINHPKPITDPQPYALSGVHSTRTLIQVDCKQQRARRLESSFFSRGDGNGRLLGHHDSDDWMNIPPDTPESGLQKAACELPDQAPPAPAAAPTPPAAAPATAPARAPTPTRRPG